LEAVSLFSPGRGLRRAAAADMARRPEALGWKLRGVLQSAEQSYEVETSSEGGNARQVKIDGKAASQVALGRLARVVWLIPAMDRLWIEGAEGRRRFLDRIALSFDPDHAEASLSYEKAMRERNRLLKDSVRDAAWYRVLETQMAEAGHRIHQTRVEAVSQLARAQAEAETAFPVAELQLVQAEGEMPESAADLRAALDAGRGRDLAAGRTLIGPHRSDLMGHYAAKGLPAKDCSTGEQKALLVSLILANARALQAEEGAAPILLLDEVAAHLDAGRRAALYDEICALGTQAWMTGTGPELFAELGDRAQHLEVTDTGGQSGVHLL
ncbi:DNA replication/repair protein RecF, partial [Phaeobacter sp. HF9A]|uniref:DNA replication/repair protein RecF n=1 Tax=Phaeobacter sp. HF9A TaxID=2721561 RepID=UPI00142F5449